MIIGLDFDGTCVTHEFPRVGKDIGAEPVLKELIRAGHKLMLWTMRDDECLLPAIQWFKDRDIPLYAINTNPDQYKWSLSNKQFAHLYIDDTALGCPLKKDNLCDKPYVDWEVVRQELKKLNIL